MSVYVISEVQVLDEAQADRYRELAADSIARYGGRYLVRGAAPEVVEGRWEQQRSLIIVEYPSAELRRRWYDSPEYAEALQIREHALDRRLLFADGPDI